MNARLKTAVQWLAEDLRRLPWRWLVNGLAASALTPRVLRYGIYRLCGMAVDSASILPGQLFMSRAIRIGKGAFINQRCFFENLEAPIEIGANTSLAVEVMLNTGVHPIASAECRCGPVKGAPIKIGSGCWLGARVSVLPGVTIGDGCVIAAGAVVTKDCEPNGLYAGVPARRIRNLN